MARQAVQALAPQAPTGVTPWTRPTLIDATFFAWPAISKAPVARKFDFSPREIRAQAGEAIILVLTASDFVHGFSIPQLNLRADVPPGQTVELRMPALHAGRYVFLCDNFCGEGHDKMSGALVVA